MPASLSHRKRMLEHLERQQERGAEMESDVQIAINVRAAVQAMNVALEKAHAAGLHVELEYFRGHRIGQKHDCLSYVAQIERREAL